MPATYHDPVLFSESIDGLIQDPNGTYVDLTFGGGGHSKGILDSLKEGNLYAFDQDPDAQENTLSLKEDNRFHFIDSNFRYFRKYLRMHGVEEVDGILADLGVSSHQFDSPERGFSTRFDAKLDMRMSQEGELTAEYVINEYKVSELQRIFGTFGEIRNSKTLANEIGRTRINSRITTVEQLNSIAKALAPRQRLNKYLAQLYQALRIEVNHEIEALEEMLLESIKALKTGGRLVVISYHSIEDRLVKNIVNYGNIKGEPEKDFFGNLLRPLKPVNRKPITPDTEEISKNPRSRSAKLRIAEKIDLNG